MKKSSKLWLSAALVALAALGYLLAVLFGALTSVNVAYDYVFLGLGLAATLPLWFTSFGAQRFHQSLMSLLALMFSYGVVLIEQEPQNFWQPVALTLLVNLCGWSVIRQANYIGSKRRTLSHLLPENASIIDGLEIDHVSAKDLEVGQVVLVRPGNVIPCDGYVLQGHSRVSQLEITGETDIAKSPGDWVLAGSTNLAGKKSETSALTIRVAAVRDNLLVHVLDSSVELEQDAPARFSRFARISNSTLTIASLAAALIVAGFHIVTFQDYLQAVSIASGILLSSQLSTTSVSLDFANLATSIKSRSLGFVIRSRKAFELLAKLNHVVFIKTGILTEGHSQVGKIHLARNTSIGTEDELLALAAAVEMGTSHELGHLIIEEAVRRGLELPQVQDIAPIPGLGVSATFDGSLVQVGNAGMVNVTGVTMNPYDLFMVSSAYSSLNSVVFVSVDELLVGYIEFPDRVRESSRAALVSISGKHAITLLSGDATALVEKVAGELGLSDYAAEVLSTRKADWIKERRAGGSRMLLIGDGRYDAEALAEADVAIAFGAGHDIHQVSSELIQISHDPLASANLIKLSRSASSRSLWNIILGLGLSALLAVAAGFGLSPVAIAAAGAVFTWLLLARISRLAK
ncbi:MAG: hypothetical protein RL140_533 [Actinomycetota bacterium]|jgi:Cu2+-exporting ATPase